MNVRTHAQARHSLSFSQVKQASAELQEPRYQELLKTADGQELAEVSSQLREYRTSCKNDLLFQKDRLLNFSMLGAVGLGSCLWASLAGHPGMASVAALVAAGAGLGGLRARAESQRHAGRDNLAAQLEQDLAKAGESVAATLVSEGPDPGQLTDRRHFRGGVLKMVTTVHARDSGAKVSTRAEVVGSKAYQFESNEAQGTVSVRSSEGEVIFPGRLEIGRKELIVQRFDPQIPQAGSLTQTIRANGESTVELTLQAGSNRLRQRIQTSQLGHSDQFLAEAYCWDKGQLATFVAGRLVVATPVVPLQELSPGTVRVLPEGVVGAQTSVAGSRATVDCSVPDSYGLGTWCSTATYSVKPRWVEGKFGGDAFSIRSDAQSNMFRADAADGSRFDGKGSLVFREGAYRIQQSQSAGTVEQSLLSKEVLLHLRDDQRTICLQHRSGQPPRATSQDHRTFHDEIRELPVVLSHQGGYQIGDGQKTHEIKPPLPLFFLEKVADG